AQTEIRQGRAAILPQVQAGYSRSKISGLQRNYTTMGTREGELDYDSTSAYIQLQQPLFNVDRYAQYQRGKARAQLGQAEFAQQEYEAAMRLATAFLDMVEAQGRLKLAQAEAAVERAKATLAEDRADNGSDAAVAKDVATAQAAVKAYKGKFTANGTPEEN